MELVNDWEHQPAPEERPRVVFTIGSFDGLHLGHKYLVDLVVKNAHRMKCRSLVLTFEPHPLEVLAKAAAPPILTTLDQKAEVLESWGVDTLGVLRFDRKMAGLDPGRFLNQMIEKFVRPVGVALGPDFTFGHNAEGNIDSIRQWTEWREARLWVAEPQKNQDGLYSSSQIRQALKDGLVEAAARALGRPYRLTGKVVHGEARGRELGFPTANLGEIRQLTPGPGVYATRVMTHVGAFGGMTSIGYNPTFGEQPMTVETNLFDFDDFLYGEAMSLDFVAHLRGMVKFESVDALVRQLELDEQKSREILAAPPQDQN